MLIGTENTFSVFEYNRLIFKNFKIFELDYDMNPYQYFMHCLYTFYVRIIPNLFVYLQNGDNSRVIICGHKISVGRNHSKPKLREVITLLQTDCYCSLSKSYQETTKIRPPPQQS